MSISTGMDVGQVDDLSAQMKSGGERLASLSAELTSQVGQVSWEGPDKVAFVGAWESAQQTLRAASGLLQETSVVLANEASAQRAASGM